ncbi:uncharacterized protein BP5553_08462 [Venustampulla echinocandica]|uniref:Lysine-specific metallo-endopeptidase domain-containing protein n=1 Tax=Venustampulla echinocandica TaxID=2656787 RepID=A0A370TEA5_9HELO|nr:uncharacterized protein BP5553_08462 [Venustampulla echinocandica]RDL33023.1 hypothetical protein BP5553_08462 [Venustampulla echinocandica]
MRLLSAAVAAFTSLSLTGHAYGYLIDPDSCKGDDYTLVKSMVEQAFTMVNIAMVEVNAQPMNKDATWLMKQLFNTEGSAAQAMVNQVFQAKPPNNKGQRTGILVFEKETTTANLDTLDQNEVVIFCDTTRLERRVNDLVHYYDKKVKQAVGKSNGCSTGAFMYTQQFVNKWDIIQVCPWFLEYAHSKKYATKADLSSLRAKMAVHGLDKLITDKFYTPIDLMSLWDKCMLHEMMHTKPGGSKQDVGGVSGYGWKNCKGLGQSGTGVNNADSWALFGSALYQFSLGSPIDENGDFSKTAIQTRSNSKRRLGSGPGRARDIIKLDTVKNFV